MIAIIAGAISLIKNSVGAATGNEDLKKSSVQSEAKNVMDKTAKGISWMEEQWEDSKKAADKENNSN